MQRNKPPWLSDGNSGPRYACESRAMYRFAAAEKTIRLRHDCYSPILFLLTDLRFIWENHTVRGICFLFYAGNLFPGQKSQIWKWRNRFSITEKSLANSCNAAIASFKWSRPHNFAYLKRAICQFVVSSSNNLNPRGLPPNSCYAPPNTMWNRTGSPRLNNQRKDQKWEMQLSVAVWTALSLGSWSVWLPSPAKLMNKKSLRISSIGHLPRMEAAPN